MAPKQDAEKAGPSTNAPPRASPGMPVRRRTTARSGVLLVFGVIVLACCVALFQRSGSSRVGDVLHEDVAPKVDVSDTTPAPVLPTQTPFAADGKGQYLIGVGKADITGPVVEINLMGYADASQLGTGLRQRLYSRAFIVGSLDNPADRFIYLVLDTQSGDTAIRYGILQGLKDMGPDYSMYGHDGLAVSGTHSHSGPGAWLNYLLPQITSKGFHKQSFRAIVDGCLLSIKRAHESLQPGSLSVGSTKIYGASINRSFFSYMANPEEERARYNMSAEDDGSVEKDLVMLKFQRASDDKNIGILNWFPTHGTSMMGNNTIITGDNKGVAADLFEKKVRGADDESDDFVAGFSQANMGDVSPRVLGAWCEDGSGEMCEPRNSTCPDGRKQQCHSRGPRFRDDDDGAASCFEIGRRQYAGALELYESMKREPKVIEKATVKAVHTFHDMAGFEFTLPDGSLARTCPAALGYSFPAGTTDGPGGFDFIQHNSNSSNTSPFWKLVRWGLHKPEQDQIDCQAPKPILLDVGEAHMPYEWTPNIVDIQTFRVGHFFIVVSPGEATTMAGRRWKEAVAKKSAEMFEGELNGEKPVVVLGGPSNSYAHYITTEEEYRIQRFEGASTLYGPHTLAAYIDRSVASVSFLKPTDGHTRVPHDTGPLPPDNSNISYSFISGVVFDGRPLFRAFGEVKSTLPKTQYTRGESVSVTFVGANPRNNLRLEQTFAAVEHREPDGAWATVRDDSDWGLIFHWRRTSRILGTSEVEIVWEIEDWAAPGEYRLRYYGDSKAVTGRITAFEGVSEAFSVE